MASLIDPSVVIVLIHIDAAQTPTDPAITAHVRIRCRLPRGGY
jgi:hypothetical protein